MNTEYKNLGWRVTMPAFAFLLATMVLGAPHSAIPDRDRDAAQIKTLAQVTSQVGKFPHPESDFFKSDCLLAELQRILGSDYHAYREHVSQSGAGALQHVGDYVVGDVSQPHVGGYCSIFYVNPKTEKMYLFWLKKAVSDKEYKIYGDGPIPAAVQASIEKQMNQRWGHVAIFSFSGERLIIDDTKKN